MLIFTIDYNVSTTDIEALAKRIKTEGYVSSRNVVLRQIEDCDYSFDKIKKRENQMEAS
jgi:hypothetical protein